MKRLSWLVASLFLSLNSLADSDALPTTYASESKTYGVLSVFFDVDKQLQDAKINIYACRISNDSGTRDFRGVGPCLFEAINYAMDYNKASTISLWVLNAQSQYLPPLRLEWRQSHKTWYSLLVREMAFLGFEKVLGRWVKKENVVRTTSEDGLCKVDSIPDKDLGNILGDLSIVLPKGKIVSDYFPFTILDYANMEKISLTSKTPMYLNRKRTYHLIGQAATSHSDFESIQIVLFTDFNVMTRRGYCIGRSFLEIGSDPATKVVP